MRAPQEPARGGAFAGSRPGGRQRRQRRALKAGRKKLREVAVLKMKQAKGATLNTDQCAKLRAETDIAQRVAALALEVEGTFLSTAAPAMA